MYIAICDDDEKYTDLISGYLDQDSINCPEYDVYHSGEELIAAYRNSQKRPDAVFLDMEMGKMNGLDTANAVRECDSHVLIIFISAHTSYMQESFRCQPFRFLVKPVAHESFKDTMREIQEKLDDRSTSIVINTERNKVRIFLEDIILFESIGHMVVIRLKDEAYQVRTSLGDILDTIDSGRFARVHRAFAVNLAYIRVIEERRLLLYHFDRAVPISRNYKRDLTDAFLDYRERQFFIG